jgi:hypothetical protein
VILNPMTHLLLAILPITSIALAGSWTVSRRILVDAPIVFEPALSSGDLGGFSPAARVIVVLNSAGAVLALNPSNSPGTVVRLTLHAANQTARGGGRDPVSSVSHYYVGKDPLRWKTGIPNFAAVRYNGLYPGIDVIYHGRQRNLEFDFELAPGADPGRIGIDVAGALSLSRNHEGDLVIKTFAGDLVQHKPVAYQDVGGMRRTVPVRFILAGKNRLSFTLGRYDHSRPLVIDPVLSYSTFPWRIVDRGCGRDCARSGREHLRDRLDRFARFFRSPALTYSHRAASETFL